MIKVAAHESLVKIHDILENYNKNSIWPDYIIKESGKITLQKIMEWNYPEHGVIKVSRNTAFNYFNTDITKKIIMQKNIYNKKLMTPEKTQNTEKHEDEEKNTINILKNSLIEIYRAYKELDYSIRKYASNEQLVEILDKHNRLFLKKFPKTGE